MGYSLRYPKYAEALYQALTEDPFYITMEKSSNEQELGRQKLLMYLDYSIWEAER